MLSAGRDERPFRQPTVFVEAREQKRVGVRVNNDRRVAARLGQVAGRLERLDGVAEVVEQLAPARPARTIDGLAQPGPPRRGGQTRAIEMLRSKALNLEPSDALGIEPIELLRQQPHRLQPLDRERPLHHAKQRLAADPAHRTVALWTEHPDVALLLGVVRHEHQRRGATTLSTFPGRPQLRFLDRRGTRVLDPVEQATRGDAIAIRAGVAGTRQRRQAVEDLGGVHDARQKTRDTPVRLIHPAAEARLP